MSIDVEKSAICPPRRRLYCPLEVAELRRPETAEVLIDHTQTVGLHGVKVLGTFSAFHHKARGRESTAR